MDVDVVPPSVHRGSRFAAVVISNVVFAVETATVVFSATGCMVTDSVVFNVVNWEVVVSFMARYAVVVFKSMNADVVVGIDAGVLVSCVALSFSCRLLLTFSKARLNSAIATKRLRTILSFEILIFVALQVDFIF